METMAESEKDSQEVTLLVDGDVVAWRAAVGVQRIEADVFGYVRPFAAIVDGQAAIDNMMMSLIDGLGATHVMVALSDPDPASNWRNELLPSYKAQRDYSQVSRPLLLSYNKDYLRSLYGAVHTTGLEADDLLGIWATTEGPYPGRKIVVSIDKDLKQIPGTHHTIGHWDRANGSLVLHEVTPAMGFRFHMEQTLSGDRIDGYSGCPGLGPERAKQIIADPHYLEPEQGVVTRGPRKGEATTKWVRKEGKDLWLAVVSQYRKAGLKEEDALRTARVARILQAGDYNEESGEIKLWTPTKQ
jgi:5'-3' exonuclease